MEEYESYLKNYTSRVQALNSKVNGDNSEEFTLEERELSRTIHDQFLDELKSESD